MKYPFLLGTLLVFVFTGCKKAAPTPALYSPGPQYDVIVYGGNASGVMAAVAASRMGKQVLLIEPALHLGGMTASGLGNTDVGNPAAITGLARDFYQRNGQRYGLSVQWLVEPHVAEQLFNDYINQAGVKVMTGYRLAATMKTGTQVSSITITPAVPGANSSLQYTISAKIFIDCSYEGDLMAQAGVSYTIGREDNGQYGETLNGVQPADGHQFEDGIDPYIVPGKPSSGLVYGINNGQLPPTGSGDKKIQAYNFRLCLTRNTNQLLPITRPEGYDSSHYELLRRIIARSEQLGEQKHLDQYLELSELPDGEIDANNKGPFSTDFIGGSWNYPEADNTTRAAIIQAHIDYTRGLLYFLGHDPGVPVWLRNEMLQLGWAKKEFRDNGGFPWQLYVRESRRMIGEYVMTEHNCRGQITVPDGVTQASYPIDSHNCERLVENGMTKNEGDVQVKGLPPYSIAYHALTPRRTECTNLLVPVCLSASHIGYASIRTEPVFMGTGEVCGAAAAMAIDANTAVQTLNVSDLQHKLSSDPLLENH
jgi:hypothetical protein